MSNSKKNWNILAVIKKNYNLRVTEQSIVAKNANKTKKVTIQDICSCAAFKSKRIPCWHLLAYCEFFGHNPLDQIHNHYKKINQQKIVKSIGQTSVSKRSKFTTDLKRKYFELGHEIENSVQATDEIVLKCTDALKDILNELS